MRTPFGTSPRRVPAEGRAAATRAAPAASGLEALESRLLFATVAYWRFEEGAADAEFQYPDTNGGPGSGLAVDEAGGDDNLRTFANFSNPTYRGDVPANTVAGTGAPNALSLEFGTNPDGTAPDDTPAPHNEDVYSAGAPINDLQLNQFTIEASVKFNNLDGWQTFVGKDGVAFPGAADANLASLYFQLANDTANQDKIAFKVYQTDGTFKDLYTLAPVTADTWYNVVAVLSNDGTEGDGDDQTLSLYLQDAATGEYVLQDQEDFRGPMAHQNRVWTVGRGMYANNPNDFVDARVDEVRISDAALDPAEFLFASAGPRVSEIFVRGTVPANPSAPTANDWTDSFKQYLESTGEGDEAYGYRIHGTGDTPAPGNPEDILPWINMNEIVVRYTSPPTGSGVPSAGSVTVAGARNGEYPVTAVTPVDGDPAAFALRLGKPLGGGNPATGARPTTSENGDRLVIAVPGGADGGGSFVKALTVLQGDVYHDDESDGTAATHTVNANDFSDVKKRFFKSTTNVGTGATAYSIFHDVDGNGTINAFDFSEVKKRFFQNLPALPDPQPEEDTTFALAGVTRDLFGTKRIL